MKQEFIKISDLCKFEYGDSLPARTRNTGSVPVYGSNGIVGFHDSAVTSGETIIVGRKGSVGEVHYSPVACFPIDTTYYISRTLKKCSLKWLYFILKSSGMTEMNKASAVPGLNRNDAYDVKIHYPPLPEQERIAAILEKADAARAKRRQANALTEEFLQSAFIDLFGDPATNPKGWKTKPLGSLCDIRRGASPRPIKEFLGGTIPWIKIGDGSQGGSIFLSSTAEHIIESGQSKSVFVPEGSLIFANCGVSLGFARILKISGCIHDGWLAFSNYSNELNPLFLLATINELTGYLRGIAPSGTQPNLNTSIMKNLQIPLPPVKMQSNYAETMIQIENLRTKQLQSEQELENLFQSLLQKAFQGKL